ncbi:hypothetical protein DFH08DRAFT_805641 [Mycena albidolilacea]|uniref:DUF4246 domain-containing protein n=1 Tax=Mycena albidolilacea TaxID=1033008 RepID=A0AAD7A8X8_9AGAR|nr:hypothetical protein DFH08DRAFT_805641 [Mycena albidolilacea]
MCAFRLVAIEAKGRKHGGCDRYLPAALKLNYNELVSLLSVAGLSSFSMGSEFARDSALSPPESLPTDRPSIAAFCDAIRAKKDWFHKILDTTRNLGLKWATEAGIDDPANDGVFPALEELKNEAQRIIFSDFEICLNDHVSSKEPESGLDVQSLDSEILMSLRLWPTLTPLQCKTLPTFIPEAMGRSQKMEATCTLHIESYINGLGPREHHPHLYRLIEKVFLLILPHFRRTLDFEYEHDHSLSDHSTSVFFEISVWRWRERYDFRNENEDAGLKRSAWEKFFENQTAEKNAFKAELEEISKGVPKETDVDATDRTQFATDNTVEAFSFQGRQLKVIVKATNYHLGPGETYEGSWHMEGMSFDVRFRPEVDTDSEDGDDAKSDIDDAKTDSTENYPSDWAHEDDTGLALGRFITLGTVPTINFNVSPGCGTSSGTSRILSFPNWIQHQVGKLSVSENTPDGYIAKRKILCFFLVDDDEEHFDSEDKEYHGITFHKLTNQVLTTFDVPFQARMSNFRTLQFILPFICRRLTGQNLPPELVQHILQSAHWGFSREEAERHCRNLMKDRVIATEESSRNDFSLCEH